MRSTSYMEFLPNYLLVALITVLFLIPVIVNTPVMAGFATDPVGSVVGVSSECYDDFGNYIC